MCTYLTEHIAVTGSGKGRNGWFRLTDATVYYDHPVHALDDHTLNIDFAAPAWARPPASRSSSTPTRLSGSSKRCAALSRRVLTP